MWRCRKCGYWEDDEQKRCRSCGAIPTAESWTCEKCNTINHIDSTHCRSCGQPKTVPQKKIEKPRGVEKRLPPRLFISHASEDKDFVKKMANDLRASGINAWIDSWEIKAGDSLIEKIQKGIQESDHMAIVLSPDSVKSEWVKRELNASIIKELEEKTNFIIPIYLKTCEIPLLIKDKKRSDFRLNYDTGFRELVEILKGIATNVSDIKKEIRQADKHESLSAEPLESVQTPLKREKKSLLQRGKEVLDELDEKINEFKSDGGKFQSLKEVLAPLMVNVEEVEKIQKQSQKYPNNIYIRDKLQMLMDTLAGCLLDAERYLRVLTQPAVAAPRSIEIELNKFKDYVEADCIDIFWVNRNEENFTEKPESKAQALLTLFLAIRVGRGKVLREAKSGIGRIDALVFYSDKAHAIEIKMLGGKYGDAYAKKGISQLFGYMHKKDAKEGHLVVFDGRSPKKKRALFSEKEQTEGITRDARKIFILIIDVNPLPPHELGVAKKR